MSMKTILLKRLVNMFIVPIQG